MAHFVAVAIGSAGDLFPFMRMALALCDRLVALGR